MDSIRIQQVIERDGEVVLTGLPFKRGDRVEVLVQAHSLKAAPPRLTARSLLQSGIVGAWRDRADIDDSSVYARQLRDEAQRRHTES